MKQLLLFALIFFSLHASSQCLLEKVPLQQRTTQSNLIIEGRVTGVRSFWNKAHTLIYTSNTVEVLKLFKGTLSDTAVEIVTEGGVVGLTMMKADPSLSLEKNDVGIFFCENVTHLSDLPNERFVFQRYEAYASVQGFIKYNLQEGTAADPFARYTNIENELYRTISASGVFRELIPFRLQQATTGAQRTMGLTGFSPASISAGTAAVLTINGSGFGATRGTGTVGFKNADDGGLSYVNPLPSQYLSWSDNQIIVQVPGNAGTGTIQVTQGSVFTSASSLTVSYAHINVPYDPGTGTQAYQTRHVNASGTGGYVWQMNTGFDANASAKASFMRAFNTWRCNTGINWTIGATTAVNAVGQDGTNVICFDNTSPLSAGILGTCYSFYSGCIAGGTVYWWVDELDIIFDEGSNISPRTWQYGTAAPSISQYDFESVAVHELGHGHQLGHVINAGAIMHYALTNGSFNRSLSANDLSAGNFVQAKSVGIFPCATAMTAYAACSTLPVTVASLNAYTKDKGIGVDWTNQAESGVAHYEVEKSTDGNAFTKATSVWPNRNDGSTAAYAWFDAQVHGGNNYYRIKSVGLSGAPKYTSTVLVVIEKAKYVFTAYPNPVKEGLLTVSLNNLAKGVYNLRLYNAAGQEVLHKTLAHAGGSSVQTLRLSTFAAGVYRLSLQGNGLLEQQTISVTK